MKVLVVCFANTCRSPVAEALLRDALHGERQVLAKQTTSTFTD